MNKSEKQHNLGVWLWDNNHQGVVWMDMKLTPSLFLNNRTYTGVFLHLYIIAISQWFFLYHTARFQLALET